MRPIVTDVPFRGLLVSVSLLNITMSCAKADEPIKILDGDWAGPKEPCT